MIRSLYKRDYRGYESIPKRRINEEVKLLKYSKPSDRNQIRKFLMEDFKAKCAYCGWENATYTDAAFHIEHTKSKVKHAELIDDYQFMALACPICNCSKNSKEIECFIDPLDPEFKTLFYRNKFGAIVVNSELEGEKKNLSNDYIKMIGLYKELYKLDYVYGSLKKIMSCESNLEEKDYEFMGKIAEIIAFMDRIARRRTKYTDF
ncbi:HNH endonuclease [Listeria seeligeri]|uniref:HNH endonuclease n=1 Tax=Listeria seeligeri TaxID=1640 RepID=UPI0010DE22D6|nr:HNH endonuclease [Listeria seeligeri]MBC1578047.1 HNH endonuclease [Listeria seeligeri]MBC1726233.1 HNH endonuclease [Listeria seeligeri]MBC1731121.1 HNH endonuclease [Listeria seeligeri]MBC1808922.1 HNH endonuclease [Listeria seeligeri]MBC1894648.1 HNH endonuclease [Listeria seeligeri]